MFKLYSKINIYIFPLTAGDNWQVKSLRESSPSPSLPQTHTLRKHLWKTECSQHFWYHRQLLGGFESS